MPQQRRHLRLQGSVNFRDLGGYPTVAGGTVRWGTLYRADGLSRLTGADIQVLLERVRLAEILDLRSSLERDRDGDAALPPDRVRYHHLPLLDDADLSPLALGAWLQQDGGFGGLYAQMLRQSPDAVATAVRVIAAGDQPQVFHCSAGKDRAGVLAALVLALAGVPNEDIVRDYHLSDQYFLPVAERLLRTPGLEALLDGVPLDAIRPLLHAPPEAMEYFLARLAEEWGGAAGYATSAGLDDADIRRLQDRLTTA